MPTSKKFSGVSKFGHGEVVLPCKLLCPLKGQEQDMTNNKTISFSDGDQYVGEHKDGEAHGQGTTTYPEYVGEVKDGKPHGHGTFTFTNGDKYVGEHKDGKRHGPGTMTFLDGKVLEGLWENGEFKGKK